MRMFESSGWSLSLSSIQAVHIVLYVRDACQLTPTGHDVPPPLIGSVENLDLGFSLVDHTRASEQWLQWWRRVVHAEGQAQLDFGQRADLLDAQPRALLTGRIHGFDPLEDFQSLEASPLLRGAALRSWRQGASWSTTYMSRGVGERTQLARSVAESITRERQVGPERLRACALILSVTGNWSCLSEPGLLLCSNAKYQDDAQFALELKEAFESGLNRPLD